MSDARQYPKQHLGCVSRVDFVLVRIELCQDFVPLILLLKQAHHLLSDGRKRAANDGIDLGNYRSVSCVEALAFRTAVALRSWQDAFPRGEGQQDSPILLQNHHFEAILVAQNVQKVVSGLYVPIS